MHILNALLLTSSVTILTYIALNNGWFYKLASLLMKIVPEPRKEWVDELFSKRKAKT